MKPQKDVLCCTRRNCLPKEPCRYWHDALYTKEQRGEEMVVTNHRKTATIRKVNDRYILEAKRLLPISVKNRSELHHVMNEFDISLVGW